MISSYSSTTCSKYPEFPRPQHPPVLSRKQAQERLSAIPPDTEEYAQLWAALHKTSGIAEVQLPNATYKVSSQQGHLLGGFGASEHFDLGQSVTLGELEGEDKALIMVGEKAIEFGHILALAGDFYGIPGQPISLFAVSEEDKEQRFRAAFDTILLTNLEQGTILSMLVDEVEKEFHDVKNSNAPHYCYSSRLIASSDRFGKIKGDVGELLIDNSDHFSDNARDAYLVGHRLACEEAAQAGLLQDQDRLKRAYALEAFACHFLTDLFAAGHVRNQRGDLELFLLNSFQLKPEWARHLHAPKWAKPLSRPELAKRLSAILTAAQHEEDGDKGLWVSREGEEKWEAYGDGSFFTPKNRENRKKATATLQESVNEVAAAYRGKSATPTQMASRLPRAEESNRKPLYEIKDGKLVIFDEEREIPIENTRDYISIALRRALDILPESYINGFIDSYLSSCFSLLGFELPKEIKIALDVLGTVFTPRLEQLTGKAWGAIGLPSSAQLKDSSERNRALMDELMSTAKASFEQGEIILNEVKRLKSEIEWLGFESDIKDLKRGMNKIHTIFARLQDVRNPKEGYLEKASGKLGDRAYEVLTPFSGVKRGEAGQPTRSLLIAYTQTHLENGSDEEKRLGATQWFRQILSLSASAFSTYLRIAYRNGDPRQDAAAEMKAFEKRLVEIVIKNQDSLILEALRASEDYIELRKERIKVQEDFLKRYSRG